jgi:hypothetical protein
VWALLSDGATWSRWARSRGSGFDRGGEPPPHGVGAIRSFGTGPIRTREEVVAFEPPQRLSYVLLSGLPVRGYRADVTLEPDGPGTHITWNSSWERARPGVAWILRTAVRDVARAMAREAGRRSQP